eukprot:c5611_g1_i1.p1 GENE.c5611_g1_i1~~c5611_g1_i1.p1  ORF type:complete len:737 (+),score=158.76 c5611_g1_i1:35-2245(+)
MEEETSEVQNFWNGRKIKSQNLLLCGVTVCQEDTRDIATTICSLAQNLDPFRMRAKTNHMHMVIVLIFDGVKKMLEETKRMVETEFQCPLPSAEQTLLHEIDSECLYATLRAYFHRWDIECDHISWIKVRGMLKHVQVLTIVKGENKGKADSHLWFFQLATAANPKYVFLTDAGTTYKSDCLNRLVNALEDDPQLGGVTGRQRATSAHQMSEPFLSWIFSPAPLQAFEFEWTSSTNMAPFTLVGFLPVMPGPCQMFSWERLVSHRRSLRSDSGTGLEAFSPLDEYIALCRPETNITSRMFPTRTLAKLAEDRLLVALFAASTGLKTKWIPGATFFYQPELKFRRLLEQRRRWTNGTVYVYYLLLSTEGSRDLLNYGLIRNKRLLQFLWMIQVCLYYMCLISPSLFAVCLRDSVSFLWKHVIHNYVDFDPEFSTDTVSPLVRDLIFSGIPDCVGYGFLVLVLLWVAMAHAINSPGDWDRTINAISWICLILSAVVMIIILTGFGMSIHLQTHDFGTAQNQIFVLVVWVLPLIQSCAFSATAAFRSLLLLPCFLLGQCFYVCFIPAYALGRLFSTSWGTNAEKVTPNANGNYATKPNRKKSSMIKSNEILEDLEPQEQKKAQGRSSGSQPQSDPTRFQSQPSEPPSKEAVERVMLNFSRVRLAWFVVVNILLTILLRSLMRKFPEQTVWVVTWTVFGPTIPNVFLTFLLILSNFFLWLRKCFEFGRPPTDKQATLLEH